MPLKILKDFGFSDSEIKIYLALLELGTARAGEIIKHSGLYNSITHTGLKKLFSSGLISYFERKKVRYYKPCDIDTISLIIENKKSQLISELNSLKIKRQKDISSYASVYEGISGFKAMCYEMIEEATKDDEYIFFGFSSPDKKLSDEIHLFYSQFTKDRLNRGIALRGLAEIKNKAYYDKFFESTPHIRYCPLLPLNNISICLDKVLFSTWDDPKNPTSFLIKSENLAEQLRSLFNLHWRNAA